MAFERAQPRLNLIYMVLLDNLMSNNVSICVQEKDVLQYGFRLFNLKLRCIRVNYTKPLKRLAWEPIDVQARFLTKDVEN